MSTPQKRRKNGLAALIDEGLDKVADKVSDIAHDFNPNNEVTTQAGDLVNLTFGDFSVPVTVVASVDYGNKKTVHLFVDGFDTKIYNVDVKFLTPRV